MKSDYEDVARAIRFIQRNVPNQPSLQDVANHLALSQYHCQRLFSRWVGISPKRFLQFLTVDRAKQFLRQSKSVLDTAYELGLSSPARIHDHFVSLEAVTPGEYKRHGEGLLIQYGIHPSPFGQMFLAVTAKGICFLSFLGETSRYQMLKALKDQWQGAEIREDIAATAAIAKQVFSRAAEPKQRINILVKGTNFQLKVWQALLMIPEGHVCSYQQLTCAIDHPHASRAVGQAVAANSVAYLIPCHRVIRKTGQLGGYRWGQTRKDIMLAWEASRTAFEADQ